MKEKFAGREGRIESKFIGRSNLIPALFYVG